MNLFTEFLGMGYLHILEGYDHLLFLTGLVIVTKEWRSMLAVVSAFTIAHSTTLVLSALGILSLPSLLTESLIAASIAYVGIENLIRKRESGRWMIAGAFGLVHGAGFSGHLVSVLKPLLGMGYVWSPIMGFNIGIELGQMSVIAVLFPLIYAARKYHWERKLIVTSSVAIALAGVTLLVLRLMGVDA